MGLAEERLAQLRDAFAKANGDVRRLEQINDQLARLEGDPALELRGQVLWALGRARRQAAPPQPEPSSLTATPPAPLRAPDLLDNFLARRGITQSDGRPLYRYGVTDSEFERLSGYMKRLYAERHFETPKPRASALFVMFAAEWFRRAYRGEGLKWDAIAPEILPNVTYAAKTTMARDGLRWWKRQPRQINGAEERLLSLALEGGLPTRVLDVRQHSWLSRFLRGLIARLAAEVDPDGDVALEIARAESAAIPKSFRQEEVLALCAELTFMIDALKRQHGKPPIAMPLSTWLDQTQDDWREDLPIRIEGDGAGKLIDELVNSSAEGLAGDKDARCERLLLWRDETWMPALRLNLDGWVSGLSEWRDAHEGRVRVRPAGALADHLSGEIAMLEPPGEGAPWRAHPRQVVPVIAPFAFNDDVTLQLTSSNMSKAVTWPKGEARRSEVLVFAAGVADSPSAPRELIYLGSGSVRTRRPDVYVLTPERFSARPDGGQAETPPVWRGQGQRLFHLTEPARIGADAAWWRVSPGQDSEFAETLDVSGASPRGMSAAGADVRIVCQPVHITARKRLSVVRPQADEVFWRRPGENREHLLSAEELPLGRIDLIWRDKLAGVFRDRQRLLVAPQGARLRAKATSDKAGVFTLENMDGWRLAAQPTAGAFATLDAGGLTVRFEGRPHRTLGLELTPPDGAEANIIAAFPIADGGFSRADGSLFDHRSRIMLHDLRGARAFAEGRRKLTIELRAGNTQLTRQFTFEDEMALWTLSEEIAGLSSGFSEIDHCVRLTIDPGGRSIDVGAFALDIRISEGVIRLSGGEAGAGLGPFALEWRSIVDPSAQGERVLWRGETLDDLPLYPTPGDLDGPGMIYIRGGETVIGRPTFLGGPSSGRIVLSPMQAAAAIGHKATREAAIDAAYRGIVAGEDGAEQSLKYLQNLAGALGGLPPSAFDVLERLPRHLPAAARLLVGAPPEATDAIWALERGLGFLWVLVPVTQWKAAFEAAKQALAASLRAVQFKDEAIEEVWRQQQDATATRLVRLDDALAWPLAMAGLHPALEAPRSQREIAISRLQRMAEPTAERSIFHDDEQICGLLPAETTSFDKAFREPLAAPCAAALRAAGRITLSKPQILTIRTWAADDRAHFVEAYSATLVAAMGAPLS